MDAVVGRWFVILIFQASLTWAFCEPTVVGLVTSLFIVSLLSWMIYCVWRLCIVHGVRIVSSGLQNLQASICFPAGAWLARCLTAQGPDSVWTCLAPCRYSTCHLRSTYRIHIVSNRGFVWIAQKWTLPGDRDMCTCEAILLLHRFQHNDC